jgi:glutathione S-transferase
VEEIILHQPPGRAWGTPNLSPFCAKLECYLRMTEIPYKVAPFARGDAPKKKIPYVELDGKFLGDSQLIVEELERRLTAAGKRALDAGMSARDAALAHVVRRTFEEAYYFVGLYVRWKLDAGYALVREEFKKFIPGLVVPLVRRDSLAKLHKQGTGRHTRDEVMAMGVADLESASQLLGERPFLLGDTPRVVDCTLFGFLEATVGLPLDTPVKARADEGNLAAYRKRIRERWWKDLAASRHAFA